MARVITNYYIDIRIIMMLSVVLLISNNIKSFLNVRISLKKLPIHSKCHGLYTYGKYIIKYLLRYIKICFKCQFGKSCLYDFINYVISTI